MQCMGMVKILYLNKINNIIHFLAETSIRNDAEKITINFFKLWVKDQFYTVVLTMDHETWCPI